MCVRAPTHAFNYRRAEENEREREGVERLFIEVSILARESLSDLRDVNAADGGYCVWGLLEGAFSFCAIMRRGGIVDISEKDSADSLDLALSTLMQHYYEALDFSLEKLFNF